MSEKELYELKNILETKEKELKQNISALKSEMGELYSCDVSDDADSATIDSDSLVDEVLSNKNRAELGEIKYIFKKMEDKSYGICEMCEDEIGVERLKVKPHARYCIDCREIVEKMEHGRYVSRGNYSYL